MLRFTNDIFYLTTTRFNNTTFRENKKYREKYKFNGCIYGVPREIPQKIPHMAKIFVLEMNNDTNEIEGIGYMFNKADYGRKYRIYRDMNYNRFTYISKHRVDRSQMTETELEYLKVLESIVFKGSKHLKRGQGITSVPETKIVKQHKTILSFMRSLFLKGNQEQNNRIHEA